MIYCLHVLGVQSVLQFLAKANKLKVVVVVVRFSQSGAQCTVHCIS